jgi:hypothetical protein
MKGLPKNLQRIVLKNSRHNQQVEEPSATTDVIANGVKQSLYISLPQGIW